MAGEDGWTRAGGPNGSTYGETPRLQEARSSAEPQRETRLRIVYDRDAQEGRRAMHSQPPSHGPDRPREGMLDRSLQAKIGRLLRDIFSDVAEEPVPKRFVELLAALAAREKSR